MNNDAVKKKSILLQISSYVVIGFSLVIYGFITCISLFETSYLEKGKVENIIYENDNFIVTLLICVLCIGIAHMIKRTIACKHISSHKMEKYILLFILIVGILWIFMSRTLPFADGKIVDDATLAFSRHDFSLLDKNQYFDKFPFQLGLTFVFSTLYQIVGYQNYLFLQLLNVVSLCAVFHYIYKLTHMLFHNRGIEIILLFLMAGCFPAILYCTFIYGTMYGFFLSTLAIYFTVSFIKEGKKVHIFYAVPCICLAILIKSNYLIVLITMLILLLLDFIDKKTWLSLIMILCILLANAIPSKAIYAYYQNISNRDIPKGIPSISWIAMGMKKGDKPSGWYNSYMFDTYKKNDFDTAKTAKMSKNDIMISLTTFKKHPKKMLAFYYEKIASQWNEPTYESLWVGKHRKDMNANKLPVIANSLYHGSLNQVYLFYANIYHFIVFLAAFLGILRRRKKLTYLQLSLLIIVLGGFFFHILWEGNSKYIITYFVYTLPFAALGLYDILVILDNKLKFNLRRKI